MQTEIKLQIKSSYGRELYYPACETSKTFARLIEATTITPVKIEYIMDLGYKVTFLVDVNGKLMEIKK